MANSITLAKQYVDLLDKIYKKASLTSDLDGANELVQQGAKVEELVIPKISMQGLGQYSRNSGYVKGDVTLTYETVKANYDRGRMFTVDTMDDEESANVAFGQLAGEFIRTKVVPELDAFRMATYAGLSGITSVGATLSSGTDVIDALRAGMSDMDENEVPEESRILYITPTLLGLVEDLDTIKSKEVLKGFSKIVKMPQKRFYTAIDLYDGKTVGEEAGGYVKDASAKDINFMIFEKSAVIQFNKHTAPKVITPQANQDADAWKYGYRCVSIADAYDNKLAGIYCHHK